MANVNRREVLGTLGAATLLPWLSDSALAQQPNFAGRTLTSHGPGGATQDLIQSALFSPFDERTKARSTMVPMQSAAALARMKAEAGNPQLDMFQFSGGQEVSAKAQGLTEPLTGVPRLARVPANLKDPDGHWVTWGVLSSGIIYRTDKIKQAPTSYKDFFKPEYKGHVAVPAITNTFGMDFFVMLARTFGGSEDNIEPAFEAAKRIKSETIFKAASDVPALFAQGDIWIVHYDVGNALKTQQSGLPVAFAAPAEGSPAVFITACLAKGSKNADVGKAMIDMMLGPESQTELARTLRWSPSNPDTKLPPDLVNEVPSLEKLVQLDREKINARRAEWTERWNREIAS